MFPNFQRIIVIVINAAITTLAMPLLHEGIDLLGCNHHTHSWSRAWQGYTGLVAKTEVPHTVACKLALRLIFASILNYFVSTKYPKWY